MKHIVRKPYWDYEKEEKWLNEMSAKGLMLTDYSWCRYVFEEGPKGEYIYRIELLPNWHSHPESMAYIRFLEESGVEFVAGYMCWVYLRKKASEGPFDIYSDIDSRIRHYRRISTLWNAFTGIEFVVALTNIAAVGLHIFSPEETYFPTSNAILAALLLFMAAMFWRLGAKVRKKITALKKEKAIRE